MDTKDSIKIVDTVYDRQKFINSTDIEFKELLNKTASTIIEVPTIEELFVMYNQLFYSIPKEGDLSHTTLIQQSSEYLGLNNNENIDIQALLDEITSLRDENYELQLLNTKLQESLSS